MEQSDFYSNCFQTFKNLKIDEEINCAICQKSLDNVNDVVTLREKGSEGINRASRERNDLIQTVPGQKHQTCSREYCHPNKINRAKKKERESLITSRRYLDRKTEQSFNFKTECFFCGTNVDLEDQKRRLGDVFRVTTLEGKHTVLQTCFERKEEWAEGRNFVGQYCESILYFWKHTFLICMFEKESGLVTAYY